MHECGGANSSPLDINSSVSGDANSLINRIFWAVLVLALAYFLLDKVVQLLLKSVKCQTYKWRPTVQCLWNICYYLASTMFLIYYHKYFIEPEVDKEVGRYFPKYENLLFYLANEANLRHFQSIFVMTLTFHLVGIVLHLREGDYTDAVTRFLYTSVVACFYYFRYEHYFLVLNICVGIYQALTHVIFLIALHSQSTSQLCFNICAVVHFLSWSYVFLSSIPFQYLLPTLYMQHFNVWLNLFCWSWYGACVWTSPILQVIYHQTFHTTSAQDCLGDGNVAKCLLLKETKDLRHIKCLLKSVEELKQATERSQTPNGAENASAKAYQTIKCIMTLKRKIKRIRAQAAGRASGSEEPEQSQLANGGGQANGQGDTQLNDTSE